MIREHAGRRGRKVDPAWQVRRRLLTAQERLRPETFTKMWNALEDTGAPGWEILHAYLVKEDLRALLALSGTNPERRLIRARLDRFYVHAAASSSPEVHSLATTIEAWWPAVEAAIRTNFSNARSEATTASPNTKDATRSGSETPSTNAAAYAGPAPANTGGRQP